MDRSVARPLVALVALAALAACAGPAATPAATDAAIDCGSEETLHGNGYSAEGRRCLLDAFLAGETATFTSGAVTIEGDPISTTFRTHGEVPVEMVVDATQDAFGSGQVELYACARLVPVADWNAERGDTFPVDAVFVEDGCTQVGTR